MNSNSHLDLLQKPLSRKPLGKLCQRLEELKSPWRQSSALELSHSETARLATDALLESGIPGYQRVLAEERELGFLSELELDYISRSGAARLPGPTAELRDRGSRYSFAEGDALSEQTSATYFPIETDSEPPLLDLGWGQPQRAVGLSSESQIIFQRDKCNSIKDTVRQLLSKAKTLIAIAMDLFTDVDILCDLLEASNKRGVSVYLLLDESNLQHFVSMCDQLDIRKDHVTNMRIRSVVGDTYCTKSGMKFNGQMLEKFMIIDLEQVLTGSYSFTWLSGQVHLNFVMLLTGELTQEFDDEFRCLYAESKPIDRFSCAEEEDLTYFTSKLRIARVQPAVKEWLADPILSNPSSSRSGSSPHSTIQTTTPASQVLRERMRTSPCASNNMSVTNRQIMENGRPGSDPLVRPSALGPKPNHVHYVLNTCLPNQTADNAHHSPVHSSRNQTSRDDLDEARTLTPPSPLLETLNHAAELGDCTNDEQKSLKGFTRTGNRMTLGHSKLEMMMEYNDKMRARNTFSRFQLMKHDP
ncbi:protein FAM83C [Rhinoraja longicauda]